MKRTFKKGMAVTMTAAMMMSLAACGSSAQETAATPSSSSEDTQAASSETAQAETTTSEAAPAEETTADLSGTISLAGSTSMEKLANAVAESFMGKYPNVTVTAEFTGSSAGIESLLAGSVDIGDASRALKDSEKEAGAVENIVAIDGIAVQLRNLPDSFFR